MQAATSRLAHIVRGHQKLFSRTTLGCQCSEPLNDTVVALGWSSFKLLTRSPRTGRRCARPRPPLPPFRRAGGGEGSFPSAKIEIHAARCRCFTPPCAAAPVAVSSHGRVDRPVRHYALQ